MRILALSLSVACSLTGCLDAEDTAPNTDTAVSELGNFPDLSPLTVEVTSANGGGCMDLPGGLPAGSVLWLQQFPCHGGVNQRLRFESMGDGTFRIHSALDPNLCLDVPFATVSGQDVQFFACHLGANQRWTVGAVNASFGAIRPASNAGLCLDVENGSTGVAKIQVSDCGNPIAANRLWRFRTFRGQVTAPACTGNVQMAGINLIPGIVTKFNTANGTLTGTCNAVPVTTFTRFCPADTNYAIANRNTINAGTAAFPIACFRQ